MTSEEKYYIDTTINGKNTYISIACAAMDLQIMINLLSELVLMVCDRWKTNEYEQGKRIRLNEPREQSPESLKSH